MNTTPAISHSLCLLHIVGVSGKISAALRREGDLRSTCGGRGDGQSVRGKVASRAIQNWQTPLFKVQQSALCKVQQAALQCSAVCRVLSSHPLIALPCTSAKPALLINTVWEMLKTSDVCLKCHQRFRWHRALNCLYTVYNIYTVYTVYATLYCFILLKL